MNTNREYTRISDPGHSWLAVPMKDVIESGVFDQITTYSPLKRRMFYLEEDIDMYTFYKAMVDKGISMTIRELEVNDFDAYLTKFS